MIRGGMEQDFFRIGMRVNIELTQEDDVKSFPSKIEDLHEDNLALSMPMKGIHTVYISPMEIVHIYFSKDSVFYCVRCEVVQKLFDPIPLIYVKPLEFVYKNQRNYFRVEASIPVEVTVVESEEVIGGYIRDLSAGGALLALKKKIKIGAMVRFQIPVISRKLEVEAMIRRYQKDDHRSINPHNVAVEYVNLSEPERDELIRYLLEEQRMLRKKGLI